MTVPRPIYFDPHGYFYVPLPRDGAYCRSLATRPGELSRGGNELVPHRGPSAGAGLLSGTLSCSFVCITPVHVGSGSFRAAGNAVAAECVRGPDGQPILPGSSIKGAVRALAEAISRSCLSLHGGSGRRPYREDLKKLPWETGQRERPSPAGSYWENEVAPSLAERARSGGRAPTANVTVSKLPTQCSVDPRRIREARLCPCCSVFGALGFRGRIAFTDARTARKAVAVGGRPPRTCVTIPERNTPQPHRLADKATWAGATDDHRQPGGLCIAPSWDGGLVVVDPLGRRFYPNWDPFGLYGTAGYPWGSVWRDAARHLGGGALNQAFHARMAELHSQPDNPLSLYDRDAFRWGEPHDVIPVGTVLELDLHFQGVLPWELGMVLAAMGVLQPWLPKMGGGKVYGLGTVRPICRHLSLAQDAADYAEGVARLSGSEGAAELRRCINLFKAHPAFHREGLDGLQVGLSTNLSGTSDEGRLHIASNDTPLPLEEP